MHAPLAVLTLWLGIYPTSFTGFFAASVAAMVDHHAQAMNVAAHATQFAGGAR